MRYSQIMPILFFLFDWWFFLSFHPSKTLNYVSFSSCPEDTQLLPWRYLIMPFFFIPHACPAFLKYTLLWQVLENWGNSRLKKLKYQGNHDHQKTSGCFSEKTDLTILNFSRLGTTKRPCIFKQTCSWNLQVFRYVWTLVDARQKRVNISPRWPLLHFPTENWEFQSEEKHDL